MHAENRKKSEKAFWFLIPVFIVILIIVFNISLGVFQERNLRRTTVSIISAVLTTNVSDMKERITTLFEENGFETEELVFSYSEDTVYIFNVHFYNMFLGTISLRDLFDGRFTFNNTGRVEVALRGTYLNGEVIIEVIKLDEIPFQY